MALLRPIVSQHALAMFMDVSANKLSSREWEDIINRASRFIEARTGVVWWLHDYSSTDYDVPSNLVIDDAIFLPWPVITLTSVTQDDSLLVEGKDNDYTYKAGESIIRSTGVWGGYPFSGEILLRGTFGYALSSTAATETPPPGLPGDLVQAALEIAAVMSGQWTKVVRSALGQEADEITQQRFTAFSMQTLRRYQASKQTRVF